MTCSLCLENARLCKSHIIPEFLYSTLYDDDHRFIAVTNVQQGTVKKGQKGFWEPLLCTNCESHIARYERYSRRLFVDPLPQNKQESTRSRLHERIEFPLMKLFILSILWRSSVSTLPVFKHVALGPHAEIIRKLLLSDDPGNLTLYPIQIFALHRDGKHFNDMIVEPTYMRVQGHKCYRFVMRGFLILIYVSGHDLPEILKRLAIRPDEFLTTYDAEFSEFAFLRDVWNNIQTKK